MSEYRFEVKLAAAMRVRAANQMVASKVVRAVLGSRGTSEITAARRQFELELEDLANDHKTVRDKGATISDFNFSIAGAPVLLEIDGKRVKRPASARPANRRKRVKGNLG
jgi:hypothetical protein